MILTILVYSLHSLRKLIKRGSQLIAGMILLRQTVLRPVRQSLGVGGNSKSEVEDFGGQAKWGILFLSFTLTAGQQQPLTSDDLLLPEEISESRDVDFTFFNDPYLFDQEQPLVEQSFDEQSFEEQPIEEPMDVEQPIDEQPLVDLTELGIYVNPEEHRFIVNDTADLDLSESRDVDFTFFNDPYAFEKFDVLAIKAKFGGYLQYSSWWDSRQVASFGDGYILLFPLPKSYDVDCRDINARGNYNAGFLETRLRAEIFGPQVLGAESYAYLETDFFGSNLVVNRLRVRHAFSKLTWKPSELMLGQYWNPTFEPRCYPLTLDFGVGEPNAIFARNPQIRYRYFKNRKEFMLVAAAQLDSGNSGPLGSTSTYLRNSRIPMLYARAGYDAEHIYAGVCIGFERIVPRLQSNKGYKVNEYLNSALALLFAKIVFEPLEIRQSLVFSQNANYLILLGGYAVATVNPATDARTYANFNTLTYWLDINITKKIEPGLFLGIAKNFGARRSIIQCITDPSSGTQESTVYGLGTSIDTLVRVAPRVRCHFLPIDFCAELECVRAAYGCLNNKGKVKRTDPVTDIRLLLSTFFYF